LDDARRVEGEVMSAATGIRVAHRWDMNESTDDHICRPFKSWRSKVGYLTLAAVVATAVAPGCGGGGCPRTANGATPCYNDHEILGCDGDPHDEGGQYESVDTCPPDRPVCQQQPGSRSGACVSLTPLMCMEELVATASGNAQIAVADIDADGLDDVVFSDGGVLWAAVARADGSFSPAVSVATAPPRWSLADLDGDGNPDLIGDAGAVDTTTVARGTGRAGFEPAQALAAIRGTVVARGDFDGDGVEDVVDDVLNNDNSQDIAVHLAASAFAAGETLHFAPGTGVFGVAAFPLQATARGWVLEVDHRVSLDVPASADLFVIGDLAGAVLATIPVTAHPADYDGDGNTDLIIEHVVALGDGAGHFQSDPARDVGIFQVTPADLDGDGRLDLEQVDSVPASSTLVTLHGTGGGNFVARAPVYVQRGVGTPAVPIHISGRPGTDLVVVATGGPNGDEIRILKGDCP
jgi:FG-GAP-like repeat